MRDSPERARAIDADRGLRLPADRVVLSSESSRVERRQLARSPDALVLRRRLSHVVHVATPIAAAGASELDNGADARRWGRRGIGVEAEVDHNLGAERALLGAAQEVRRGELVAIGGEETDVSDLRHDERAGEI